MSEVEVDFGLETKSRTAAPLKTNQHKNARRRTPLQYACSLGLFQIVARLLKEGANPDLLASNEVLDNQITRIHEEII